MSCRRKRRTAEFVTGEAGSTSTKERLPTSYTPEQLARALQVSRQSITRRCQSGTIRAIRIGVLWRILISKSSASSARPRHAE